VGKSVLEGVQGPCLPGSEAMGQEIAGEAWEMQQQFGPGLFCVLSFCLESKQDLEVACVCISLGCCI